MTNFTVKMCRQDFPEIQNPEHAGLLIDRGFRVDRGDKLHNDDKMDLFADAKNIPYSPIYAKAYENWQQTQIENENAHVWFGKLENRMYLGLGVFSPLEAGITLHHTYGVPFIPGSAIKGVLRHYVDDLDLDKNDKIIKVLFGEDASNDNKQDSGESGCLIFNDAWWIPEGKALAPETITVHVPKYYVNKGKDFLHPDLESPNPNPQIAIQGSFMFSVEGEPKWVEYAIKLLEQALIDSGIGGKSASGYGYFAKGKKPVDEKIKKAQIILDEMLARVKREHNIPDDKQAFGSKPMAEEWKNTEDEQLKKSLLVLLQKKWKESERSPSKKAQNIYDQA